MAVSLPWGEIAWLVAALLLGGLLTGLLAGLFGIGGGGVLVPILHELFTVIGVSPAIRMHLAVGTALAIIIPTSLRSFASHHKKGAVDMELLRRVGPAVAAGVGLGILVASWVEGYVLKLVYVIMAVLMAVNLFFGRGRWRISDDLPGGVTDTVVGAGIGLVSTLIGIGGGVLMTTYMTLCGRKIHQAVATSAGLGPIIAIPATAGFVWAGLGDPNLPPGSLGYVSLLGAAIVIPASVLAAPIGVRIAHGISRRSLEVAFGGFLTLVAIRFLLSLTWQ